MSTRRTTDMTTGAQGALAVPNIRDWGCEPVSSFDEDGGQVDIAVDFYQVGLSNPKRFIVTVTNTVSTRLSRNVAPTGFDDMVVRGTLATPTGFTSVLNGYRGGASKSLRQKGLADALIALGVIDAGLGGVTS